MKIKIMIAFALLIGGAQAQDMLPTNPEPGKCYVKCITPDVYKNVEEKIMVKPAYKVLKVIPATYKTVTERVLVKEASKQYKYIPAEYETVEVSFVGTEGSTKIKIVEASLNPSSEKIEVFPAIGRWEYSSLPDCESENPNDCQVLCWKEYPAQYKTINTQILGSDASTTNSPVAELTKSYAKRVIKTPARTETIEIPAEYSEITRSVLVKDETIEEVTVPAEYTTVTKEVLVSKGGVTVWEEIDCKLTDYNILPIFYDFNSAALTSAAKKVIDEKLLSLMKEQPNISIELSSHTDSRGNDQFNLDLSERRARSVVNYLISRGINSSRLVAKGYGETKPKNRCTNGVTCTEKEHQANRRTEFRVINQ